MLPLLAQVPQGATPRTLKVHLCGELTRTVKPGDAVTISGIFLPEPFTGFRAMRAGLVTNTFLEAQSVALDKKSYADIHMTPEQRATIAVRKFMWSNFVTHVGKRLPQLCFLLTCYHAIKTC